MLNIVLMLFGISHKVFNPIHITDPTSLSFQSEGFYVDRKDSQRNCFSVSREILTTTA